MLKSKTLLMTGDIMKKIKLDSQCISKTTILVHTMLSKLRNKSYCSNQSFFLNSALGQDEKIG